jgi:hypothetical protein
VEREKESLTSFGGEEEEKEEESIAAGDKEGNEETSSKARTIVADGTSSHTLVTGTNGHMSHEPVIRRFSSP